MNQSWWQKKSLCVWRKESHTLERFVLGNPAVHRSLSFPWYVSGSRGGSKISKPRFLNSVTLSQIDWNRPDPDGLRNGLRMIDWYNLMKNPILFVSHWEKHMWCSAFHPRNNTSGWRRCRLVSKLLATLWYVWLLFLSFLIPALITESATKNIKAISRHGQDDIFPLPGVEDRDPTARFATCTLSARSYGGASRLHR